MAKSKTASAITNAAICVAVLLAICVTVGIILSVANKFTAPKIEENQRQKVIAAMKEVYPEGEVFSEVDISALGLPEEITEVYAVNDGGYVFKASVRGYSTGLIIMCGIDADGKITGTKYIESKETNGAEGKLNGAFNGLTSDSLSPVIIGGSTKTSQAYHSAVELSFKSFAILTAGKGDGN